MSLATHTPRPAQDPPAEFGKAQSIDIAPSCVRCTGPIPPGTTMLVANHATYDLRCADVETWEQGTLQTSVLIPL